MVLMGLYGNTPAQKKNTGIKMQQGHKTLSLKHNRKGMSSMVG